MDWIKWDHTLVLGHDALDAEHRQLVALVNQLANCIVTNAGKEAYDALLDDLLSHTRAHFGTEERLMAACAYPYAEEHRAVHVRLIKDALDYRAKFSDSTQPSISLLFFFDKWLSRHILTFDRELASFLAGIK